MKELISALPILFITFTAMAQNNDEQEIRTLLSKQVTEWNKGNAAGYMKGYWKHDSLVFIGKNGPTYGYDATLQRYKKSYPDAEAMGTLTSTIISMKKLSADYYFVTGKWHLTRKQGDLNGSYTLLLQRINGEWVIINDHSS